MSSQSALPRLLTSLLVVFAPQVFAQTTSVVQWSGSVGVINDDNLLRAPSGSEISDQITTQTLGVKVALPLGLQRLEVDAKLAANQYQKKSDFDNISQNYNAVLRWTLAPQLSGALSTSRVESLVEAVDSLTPNQRNRNTTTTTSVDAAYELGGPWQLSVAGGTTSSLNERAVIGAGDNRFNNASIGFVYSKNQGNSLSYSFQHVTGTNIFDYVSTVHTLSGARHISGNILVNAKISDLNQKFSSIPAFDFSGLSGNVNVSWNAAGRTSLAAGWQRDLTSFQTPGTTHTQTDAITLAPAWQASSKINLRLQFRNALRSDQGDPFGKKTNRQDAVQDVAFTASWAPYAYATLTATVSDTTMSSNVKALDFTDRKTSFSAQFSF